MRKISELLAETNMARFLTRYERPFLILIKRSIEDEDEMDFYTGATLPIGGDDDWEPSDSIRLQGNAEVFELKKRQGANPFSALITMGRADNCDIVFRSSAVSKFHAYITVVPQVDNTIAFQLADGTSRNGTTLNDTPIAPKSQATLKNGDLIEIGGVFTLIYFTPKGLWEQLEKLRDKGE